MKIADISKVVVIHCIESAEREKMIAPAMEALGVDKYEIHKTCFKPWLVPLANIGRRFGKYYNNKTSMQCYGQLDCMINHYSVVKQSYLEGDEYLMVCEDDIQISGAAADFNDALTNLPEDWELAQFRPNTEYLPEYPLWRKHTDMAGFRLYGTQLYLMNRRGMKFYIDFADKALMVADQPMLCRKEKGCMHYVYNGKMVTTASRSLINNPGF